MYGYRLFALLWDGRGGVCRISTDGRQRFLFERTRSGVLVERFRSKAHDPDSFHRYVYELGARGWSFAWASGEGGGSGNRDHGDDRRGGSGVSALLGAQRGRG